MYEGYLCVCCMSTDDLVDLFVTKTTPYSGTNYAKILNACLNIELSAANGQQICTSCVAKLNSCVSFKKQALKSICILSSINLTELVTADDIEVLGLDKGNEIKLETRGRCSLLETDIKIEELCEEEHGSFSKQNDVGKQILAKRKKVTQNERNKVKKAKPVAPKRSVGRPRIRPPDLLPYRIGKHELTCRECGEEFPCHLTLKVHYNTHFGRHTCEICSKSFMMYTSLKKHETTHLLGPFPCTTCGQEFHNINTLNSHKRYKHRLGPAYSCSECGAAFSTLTRRLDHIKIVHGRVERRHRCKYCHKRFAHAGERAKHIASKHEIKFFPCPVCGVQCRQSCLRVHLRRHEGGHDNKKKKAERRFSCKLCNKYFTQKVTLKYHIGSHVRRGQYRGDPNYLMVDHRDPKAKNTGLLSEDEIEEHLDESLLSDTELKKETDELNDTAEFDDIDIVLKNIDKGINGRDTDEIIDEISLIFTDIDFSVDSYEI